MPGAPQTQQDLLDIVAGQPLDVGDLAPGDRTFGRAPREMQRADDAVFGESGDAHD